jgi:hypothetical protein
MLTVIKWKHFDEIPRFREFGVYETVEEMMRGIIKHNEIFVSHFDV